MNAFDFGSDVFTWSLPAASSAVDRRVAGQGALAVFRGPILAGTLAAVSAASLFLASAARDTLFGSPRHSYPHETESIFYGRMSAQLMRASELGTRLRDAPSSDADESDDPDYGF